MINIMNVIKVMLFLSSDYSDQVDKWQHWCYWWQMVISVADADDSSVDNYPSHECDDNADDEKLTGKAW